MSGDGGPLPAAYPALLDPADERADAIAYLRAKALNARRVAQVVHNEEADATLLAQRLTAIADDLAAGLHEGAAAVAGVLAGAGASEAMG